MADFELVATAAELEAAAEDEGIGVALDVVIAAEETPEAADEGFGFNVDATAAEETLTPELEGATETAADTATELIGTGTV